MNFIEIIECFILRPLVSEADIFTDYFITEEKIEEDIGVLSKKVDDMNGKQERIEELMNNTNLNRSQVTYS